jgi:hypothetical protein
MAASRLDAASLLSTRKWTSGWTFSKTEGSVTAFSPPPYRSALERLPPPSVPLFPRDKEDLMAGTLTSQELFGFLTPDQVNLISENAEKVELSSGQVVYDKGDKADRFYIVLDGEVTLRLPGTGNVNIVIDQLGRGDIFGGPLGFGRSSYALTAQCTQDAQLLRIEMAAMKYLMDRDERMGYHLQGFISTAYFNRYIDTMKKLQAIVMNIPMEAGVESETPSTLKERSHHA